MLERLKMFLFILCAIFIGGPLIFLAGALWVASLPLILLDIPIWIIWDKTPINDLWEKIGDNLP